MVARLIKTTFSIKDLENLSGIKAHTIRIWESRYEVLSPERTEGNQRRYSSDSLKKLLNLAYLLNKGFKISKLSKISRTDLELLINQEVLNDTSPFYYNDQLKLAILAFDEDEIERIIDTVIEKLGPEIAYSEVVFPLLSKIGLLWQSSQITPAHEHFVAHVVKQKIILNTARIPQNSNKIGPTFVLFLPDLELHEIGLLYVNFYLRMLGAKTVFLGQSTPAENLNLFTTAGEVVFISHFTIAPTVQDSKKYLIDLDENVLKNQNAQFWYFGRPGDPVNISNRITLLESHNAFKAKLDEAL